MQNAIRKSRSISRKRNKSSSRKRSKSRSKSKSKSERIGTKTTLAAHHEHASKSMKKNSASRSRSSRPRSRSRRDSSKADREREDKILSFFKPLTIKGCDKIKRQTCPPEEKSYTCTKQRICDRAKESQNNVIDRKNSKLINGATPKKQITTLKDAYVSIKPRVPLRKARYCSDNTTRASQLCRTTQ